MHPKPHNSASQDRPQEILIVGCSTHMKCTLSACRRKTWGWPGGRRPRMDLGWVRVRVRTGWRSRGRLALRERSLDLSRLRLLILLLFSRNKCRSESKWVVMILERKIGRKRTTISCSYRWRIRIFMVHASESMTTYTSTCNSQNRTPIKLCTLLGVVRVAASV